MISRGLGFIESGVNPNDAIYAAPKIELPKSYELKEQLRVYDQGNKGSCVSCTVAEMFNFYCKSKGRESGIGFEYIYDNRADKTIDGMMPREAFEILKRESRIDLFARVTSLDALKKSVLVNGAALIAMNVFSYNDDFWDGDEFMVLETDLVLIQDSSLNAINDVIDLFVMRLHTAGEAGQPLELFRLLDAGQLSQLLN